MANYLPLPTPPYVAILRGLTPTRAGEVGSILYDAGFRLLEVPLNRPGALEAIAILISTLPKDALVGAGTVLTPESVDEVAAAGGKLIISPDCNPAVIARAVQCGLWSVPGVATPSEAFAALRAGAHALKAFPAEGIPPEVLKAWRAVIPSEVPILPVGGVTVQRLPAYLAAGASGFGLGGQLFQPEVSNAELAERAQAFVAAWPN